MNYIDIYMDSEPENVGHAPDQIYAYVPVTEQLGTEVLAYLCRVNQDQYDYMVAEEIPFYTWDNLPKTGPKSKIKIKIKDNDNKDKEIPTMVFGDGFRKEDGKMIKPNKDKPEPDVPIVIG